MRDRLEALAEKARGEIRAANDAADAERLRVHYLGKKGELSEILKGMGKLPPEERRSVGEGANALKAELEGLLGEAAARFEAAALEAELSGPALDVTLPGRTLRRGHIHPVTQTLRAVTGIFHRLGFETAEGPEIERDYYNFEALNFPADHPARDMQDTFFVEGQSLAKEVGNAPVLLRTHTSPVQIRAMLERQPPLQIIAPGRVYRWDFDITHTPMFHQVEGLLVDQGITLAHLKGTLDAFARAFFGGGTRTRFRPSFFPFTEPSAEMDIGCILCSGRGCRVCKGTGWLEILGSGMVHPNVFRAVGYETSGERAVTGFAFGMGVERLAMLSYGLDDIRMLFENDVRFLEQF
jgi:phenylalanyl-tRNA synthetase alpha chain